MSTSDDRILQFSELLQESRSRVFGFIYAIVLNLADTEDLFQQTATLLWEKFDEFEPGTDFTSWALRIARFKASNFLRSKYREQKRFSNSTIEELYLASVSAGDESRQERLDALKGCMAKLNDTDRGLLMRCYTGGLRINEIAADEGKTANAIYAALHRIRCLLIECVRRTLAAGEHPQLRLE
jgi:RNA polymerase sigma-70 factor (ECF subfamily)